MANECRFNALFAANAISFLHSFNCFEVYIMRQGYILRAAIESHRLIGLYYMYRFLSMNIITVATIDML